MKKLQAGLLILTMIVAFLATEIRPMDVQAAQDNTAAAVTSREEVSDDPLNGRASGDVDSDFYGDESTEDSSVIAFQRNSASGSVQRGIDVSSKNGTVDWNKAKQAGVEFAIIRVAFRGYGSTGSLNEDTNFRKNLSGAANAGIPVGVYIYSQAIYDYEAVDEANYIMNLISGYTISLPVVIDYEYATSNGAKVGRLYNANLTVERATSIVKSFCATVAAKGYTPMVYANKYMLNNQLDAASITSQYQVWLAHYTTTTDYDGQYSFWQYSETGVGADYGCSSDNVDLDYWYLNAVPMYRMYNPNSGEHFYTAASAERNNLVFVGWKYEGIGWYAPTTGDPVYRLYNANAGDHHYTMNAAEKDNLVRLGWSYEGIGWYSDPSREVPLYRAYNPNAKSGSHNYTTSLGENNFLTQNGWSDEGIAWYGVN